MSIFNKNVILFPAPCPFQAPLKPKDRRRRGQEGVRFGLTDDWHPWFLGLRIHKLLTLCS